MYLWVVERCVIGALLMLGLLPLAGCDSGSNSSRPSNGGDGRATVRCNHLDEIQFAEYFLQNNMWGRGDATDYEQCVERSGPDPFPLAWHWDWPEDGVDRVRGYPFVGFGQDPWRQSSSSADLPLPVKDVRTLDVEYRIRSESSGKYNLAFDIWITAEPGVTAPPDANVSREIMIWLQHSENPLPPFWLVEEVTIGGESYEFYKGEAEPTETYVRDYLAFVKTTPELEGATAIHEFLRYLLDKGHLSADEYVRNVFLGNEVWHGAGETFVDAYSVQVNR